jgi:putative transposase
MKWSRYTEEQIIGILKEQEAWVAVVELCCKHSMSGATFYNWESKYGGLEVSKAKRLRTLEAERRSAEAASKANTTEEPGPKTPGFPARDGRRRGP